MKKKTLLSLLTGIAIVASTAGTYAAWDETQAENSNSVTLNNPTTITLNKFTLNDQTALGGQAVAETKDATFTLNDTAKSKADTLTIVPTVSSGDTTLTAGDDYSVTIADTGESDSSAKAMSKNNDKNAFSFDDKTLASTTYDVKVTLTNQGENKVKENTSNSNQLTVKLTGKLSKTQQASAQ